DDFDLNSLTTKNSHMPEIWITMLGGSLTWQDTNGDQYDFFIFEGAGSNKNAVGNDQLSIAPILVPELPGTYDELSGKLSDLIDAGVIGEPVQLDKTAWMPTDEPVIELQCTARNGGQWIGGIAWKVTDMLDDKGEPLTNESVIYGVLVSSGGVDPGCFCAVKGVPEAPAVATNPSPGDGMIMVALNTQLSWRSGKDAVTQTLYLSTNQDDVINGVGGVTVTDESHDPGGLQAETKYFWRIDTSDGTETHAGQVWSFTTVSGTGDGLLAEYFTGEEYLAGDPVLTRVDPEIDFNWNNDAPGAGIDREQFSARWRGEITIPVDGTYKFVLNSNDGSRLYLDGQLVIDDWSNHGRRDTLGSIDLAAGTYPIRVEYYQDAANAGISVSWESDIIERQVIPAAVLSSTVRAELISPAMGAEQVSQDVVLRWIPVDASTQNDVYLGTDAAEVEAADTSSADIYQGRQDGASLSVAGLSLGTTYYWRADQVAGNTVTTGRVWSFTVAPARVIEDFESYTEDFEAGEAIYQTWIDGYETPNENGAVVGNGDSPEYDLVNFGAQSMPLHYYNTEAKLSEATRTFDPVQDWTQVQDQPAEKLQLWIRGNTALGEFSYDAEKERYTVAGTGEGLDGPTDSFRFVYKQLTGDGVITARLLSLTGLAYETPQGVMIRETLDAGSAFAMAAFRGDQQANIHTRSATGADSVKGTAIPGWPATLLVPQWLRLTRSGDSFTAEHSVDGATWNSMGDAVSVPMSATVYVGLAVSAQQPNDDRQVNRTTWEGVDIVGTVDEDGPITKMMDIGIPLNSEEELYLFIEDSVGGSAMVPHPDGVQVSQVQDWVAWNVDLSTLTGVDLSRIEKLTIGMGKKNAPVNNGVGTMFIDDIRLYPSALAHHWTLDEDTAAGATIAADSVGGKDGVINGAVTGAGVLGNALSFDGTSNVEVADFSTADLKSMTITFWMNPEVGFTATPDYKRVISAGDHWEVVMQPDTGVLGNNFYQKGGTYPQSTVTPAEGEWTFVAMTSVLGTAANPGRMEIYLNGELDIAADNADDDWEGGTVLFAHRPGRGDNERYKGLLDDIRIYNDVLSQADIESIMNEQ
ncbi:MAG: PA14 domain-containing protein, partial [Planctomycetota bacterium]